MIESIRLRNYRGHTDTTIPCGRLTVLVGENAAGKSSVLRAVESISRGIYGELPLELLRSGATEVEIYLAGHGPRVQLKEQDGEVTAGNGEDVAWHIDARYQLTADNSLRSARRVVLDLDGAEGNRPTATFLSLSGEALAAPSSSKAIVPRLDPSGSGLASVLAYLKLAHTDRFERVLERLRMIVPLVRDVSFGRVEQTENVSRFIRVEDRQVELTDAVTSIRDSLLFNFADAEKVTASTVSEGTLIALGILTALELFHLERSPVLSRGALQSPVDVVLIDDIDRALHPRAQRKLIETLLATLGAIENLQILATTHSPYLWTPSAPMTSSCSAATSTTPSSRRG